MLFAEVEPDCKGEEDVYHDTPFEATNSGKQSIHMVVFQNYFIFW
jgi:hypothetical protein